MLISVVHHNCRQNHPYQQLLLLTISETTESSILDSAGNSERIHFFSITINSGQIKKYILQAEHKNK